MRHTPLLTVVLACPSFLGIVPAMAADVAAGRATAANACAECHEPRDWEGESAESLESLIRDVVNGSVKHSRKVQLTPAEIANIAAYWASSAR